MDLNLIYDDRGRKDDEINRKVRRAFEFGYETVAINTIVDSTVLDEKTAKIPEPAEVTLEGGDDVFFGRKLKILNRLTAVIKETVHAHRLIQSPNTKKYDIIAIQPIGEKMLQHACSTLDIEIICVDLTEKLSFSFKRTYLNQAKERGICFEIQYAPCLRDETARRWVISNAQILVQVLKSHNVLLSSGAWKVIELRGVPDVINLGNIFGLKCNLSRAAVVTNGKLVLSHSKTRLKTGCGFVSVEEIFKLSHRDKWLVKATVVPKVCSDDDSAAETVANSEMKQDEEPPRKFPKIND